MIWIRTIKNNYDMHVIIDSTDNEHFVNTSGLEWTLLSEVDTLPENGSYYHEGMIIPFGSDDYDNIIVPLIDEIEEPLKIERDKIEEEKLKIFLEEMELERQKLVEEESPVESSVEFLDSLVDEIDSNPPDPTDIARINQLTSNGIVDPRNLPKPVAEPIPGVESTEENFEIWYERYLNTSSLIDALISKKYKDVVENVVIFDPPHKFPDGVEQSNFPFPEDSVEEYINHLIAIKGTNKDLLDTICNDLDLPLIES